LNNIVKINNFGLHDLTQHDAQFFNS